MIFKVSKPFRDPMIRAVTQSERGTYCTAALPTKATLAGTRALLALSAEETNEKPQMKPNKTLVTTLGRPSGSSAPGAAVPARARPHSRSSPFFFRTKLPPMKALEARASPSPAPNPAPMASGTGAGPERAGSGRGGAPGSASAGRGGTGRTGAERGWGHRAAGLGRGLRAGAFPGRRDRVFVAELAEAA